MKQLVLMVCLCALSLSGCTKFGKNITVKGRVLNPVTGEGVAGIEIWIQRSTSGLPGGYKTVQVAVSGEDGSFEISKLGGLNQYYIRANTYAEYYPLGWYEGSTAVGYDLMPIKKGKTVEVDYQLVPYGDFVLHVKNTNCINANDSVKLYLDGSQIGFDDVQIGLLTELVGCIDITDTPVKFPIGKRYYHWVATKNGASQTYYDTVTVIEGQTIFLNVFY